MGGQITLRAGYSPSRTAAKLTRSCVVPQSMPRLFLGFRSPSADRPFPFAADAPHCRAGQPFVKGRLTVRLELADPAVDRLSVYIQYLENFLWRHGLAQHQVDRVEHERLVVMLSFSFGHLEPLLFVIL